MKIINHTLLAIIFATGIFTISCEKSEITPDPDQINLQEPVAGQENYYIRYSGPCGQLEPTGDTLIVRVKEFDGTTIQFEEIFTEGSPSYNPLPYFYNASWSNEMLTIDAQSRQFSQLFFFYGSDSLKLQTPASNPMYQNNCVVWDGDIDFTGDKIGVVPVFKVAGEKYKNKKIVSCVPVILDMDAYLLYDQYNLYSSFTSAAGGWEPMDDPFTTAYALIDINQ